MKLKQIWADGSFSYAEKRGFTCVVTSAGEELVEPVSVQTHNEAEYLAVLKALMMSDKHSVVFTDSALVYGHLVKGWRIGEKRLVPFYLKAKGALELSGAKLQWVGRKHNVAGEVLERMVSQGCYRA